MKAVISKLVSRVSAIPSRRFLLLLFFLALAIRIPFIFWNPIMESNDLYEHGAIAHNIVTGHGFAMHWPYDSFDSTRQAIMQLPPAHEGAFLPPLNPYLLAGFYEIFGENDIAHTAYGLLMCLISACIPLALYYLTKHFATEGTARLAALLACLNIFAAYTVSTFTGSALYQLAAPLSLSSLLVALERKSIRFYIMAGILSGVMTLLRSEYFLLGPILIAVCAWMSGQRLTGRLQFAAIAVVAHLLIITPWVYRNYQLFDKFVPVLSHPWYEIWRGNNPRANGATLDATGRSIWVDSHYDKSIVSSMDSLPYNKRFEVAADSIFKEEVLRFWSDDPLYAASLAMKKIGMFITSDFHRPLLVDIGYAPVSFILFLTAVIGIISIVRSDAGKYAQPAVILFGFFLAYYLALTFFTVMLPRYQIYVLNTLLPMSAVGITVLYGRLGDKRKVVLTANVPNVRNDLI